VARQAIDWARLVTLRGIGSAHAQTLARVGVHTVCSLARRSPGSLWNAVKAAQDDHGNGRSFIRPSPAEVRVWIAAARHDCEDQHAVPVSSTTIHEAQ
jgi:NAD(P)-dependent dehydrogenase (short-subunit alcohol dehydrogenase family)